MQNEKKFVVYLFLLQKWYKTLIQKSLHIYICIYIMVLEKCILKLQKVDVFLKYTRINDKYKWRIFSIKMYKICLKSMKETKENEKSRKW